MVLMNKMPFLFFPERYGQGMSNFLAMAHQNGVTSLMDMGIGTFGDPIGETKLIRDIAEEKQAPSRIVLTPIITDFLARGKSISKAIKEVKAWEQGNSHRVMFDKHFKIMMDGAIFSGASQINFPGYMDNHEGMWMAPLETTYQWAEAFWNEGYQIHAHTNGDKSTAALIDITRRLQKQNFRLDHRLTLEHFVCYSPKFRPANKIVNPSEKGVHDEQPTEAT